MELIVSRDEMQDIDAYSIHTIGIPGIVLMEKAAMAMEEEIVKRFPKPVTVVVVTEKGNNGGDGLAVGRLFLARGYDVLFYEIGGIPRASESYEVQKNILDNLGISFCEQLPEKADIWIDAVFGVGLTREVKGVQKQILEQMNQKSGYKIAVDVPSGVDGSTGQILGCGFQADLTITFGLNKIGLVLYPGASFAGEVVVKDIGFPKEAVAHVAPKVLTYSREDLDGLPKRSSWSNKGTYGKVLLIAGSENMSGAAYLSGKAAYKSGTGLVRIFTCEENRVILQSQLPEAIMTTYSTENEALEKLSEAIRWATVIGIGPGIGQTPLSKMMVKQVLAEADCPLVIDADGINCLSALKREKDEQITFLYENYKGAMILTPHLKEMSRLTGQSIDDIRENFLQTVKNAADSSHIYVLKDARTLVSDGAIPTYINMSGNHGMAVGGSGDVLTGIICGFLAGGLEPLTAARLGVFCHGLSGDVAANEKGYYGLMAGDLIEYLYRIIH